MLEISIIHGSYAIFNIHFKSFLKLFSDFFFTLDFSE